MVDKEILRKTVVAVTVTGQAALPTLLSRRLARVTEPVVPRTKVTPAPATFAIWLPIFASSAGYAVRHARSGPGDIAARVAWPAAAAFASTGVWAPLVVRGRFWAAQATLAGIGGWASVAAARVARAEQQAPLGTADRWLVAAPLAMLAGWGTAATGVNLTAMLKARGIATGGRSETVVAGATVAGLLLAGAGFIGVAGARTVTARTYGATLLWSLGGIAMGRRAGSATASPRPGSRSS